MSTLLRRFIQKKLTFNNSKKNPAEELIDKQIFDFKSPTIASFHLSNEKTMTNTHRKKEGTFFIEKDKKIEQLENEMNDFKKKIISFYFSLKDSLLLENVCKLLYFQ